MNIYRFKFVSLCPNNNMPIVYRLEVQKDEGEKIMVEHFDIAVKLYDKAYHEDLADFLIKQFGGRQILTAHHHGVDIETRRGFDFSQGRLTHRVQIGGVVYEKGTMAALAVAAIEMASR